MIPRVGHGIPGDPQPSQMDRTCDRPLVEAGGPVAIQRVLRVGVPFTDDGADLDAGDGKAHETLGNAERKASGMSQVSDITRVAATAGEVRVVVNKPRIS